MLKRLQASAARALGDYSLRRFLAYAANPLHWRELSRLRQRARREREVFAQEIAHWRQQPGERGNAPRLSFRPWLQPAPTPDPAVAIGAADAASDDPELRMRVDRLGWMLEQALQSGRAPWAEVRQWRDGRWATHAAHTDSYTLAERIGNLVLLWNLEAPPADMAEPLLDLVGREAAQLLERPEYHGEDGTNNHILNNARALILAGDFLDCATYFDAGCWLLQHQLGRHILPDGVVREASSHYQWVVTRWLVEVACVLRARNDARFGELQPLLDGMLVACDAMLLGAAHRPRYQPLLGDISPDFPPAFYGGLTGFGRLLLAADGDEPSKTAVLQGFWSYAFRGHGHGAIVDWMSADGAWLRLARGPWSLLAHTDTHPDENRSSHAHHDLFSFELACDGVPVIIDPGRRDYRSERDTEAAGTLEEWHNTLMLAGHRTGFMPRSYMPPAWLARFRARPRVVLAEGGADIILDGHPASGVSLARSVRVIDDRRVTIRNTVTPGPLRVATVIMVLYVRGSVTVGSQQLRLASGGQVFTLAWRGLAPPQLRSATQYVAYAAGVPCTRLEWRVDIGDTPWESSIDIAREVGNA